MIVYLDTSAFLKLYLDENGSNKVRDLVREAVATCTHTITYAEMRAGLARASRMLRLNDAETEHQKERFEADWAALHVINVDERAVRRAGELAEGFGLRGYDSVHLACAERCRQIGGEFHFTTFDRKLNEAARLLGMDTVQSH
jgi:predicted nucleic acid-binding protein